MTTLTQQEGSGWCPITSMSCALVCKAQVDMLHSERQLLERGDVVCSAAKSVPAALRGCCGRPLPPAQCRCSAAHCLPRISGNFVSAGALLLALPCRLHEPPATRAGNTTRSSTASPLFALQHADTPHQSSLYLQCTESNTESVAEDEIMRMLILIRNFVPGWKQIVEGGW